MENEERVLAYIDSLDTGNTSFLRELEREANAGRVPVIKKETQRFIKLLLSLKRPARILEVGTAVGFSALLMAQCNPVPCEIVTIENYAKRIPIARENFKKAKRDGQITLLEGDASELLPKLEGTFDFVFLDAAKGQYLSFLPHLVRLLRVGGVLLADNVLRDGEILESRFAVTRRNRTIHKRMRQFLYEVTHHRELDSTVLPIGDGLAVSLKKESAEGQG